MPKRVGVFVVLAAAGAVVVGALASFATAQSGGQRFSAERLRGSFEVPAVSTDARGEFEARIVETSTGPELRYKLSYSGLNGSVQQAHIHFGQNFVNGGIVVWLCDTPAPPPPGIDDPTTDKRCPQEGTVEGVVKPAQVVQAGNGTQQLLAGEFDEVVDAMRAGLSYANVHTSLSPGGEIRAQIRRGGGDDDD
jgi:CHRD domain